MEAVPAKALDDPVVNQFLARSKFAQTNFALLYHASQYIWSSTGTSLYKILNRQTSMSETHSRAINNDLGLQKVAVVDLIGRES